MTMVDAAIVRPTEWTAVTAAARREHQVGLVRAVDERALAISRNPRVAKGIASSDHGRMSKGVVGGARARLPYAALDLVPEGAVPRHVAAAGEGRPTCVYPVEAITGAR